MPCPSLIGLYSPAPGCGKTTAAQALGPWGYNKISFADPLREALAPVLRGLGHDPQKMYTAEFKEEVLPEVGKSTRDMLRTLGTEWGRQMVHEQVWMIIAKNKIQELHNAGLGVVIDDVRFPNEVQLVRQLGGILIRIERPGIATPSTHASDTSLNEYQNWDHVIVNNDTAPGLALKMVDLIESLEVES